LADAVRLPDAVCLPGEVCLADAVRLPDAVCLPGEGCLPDAVCLADAVGHLHFDSAAAARLTLLLLRAGRCRQRRGDQEQCERPECLEVVRHSH